MKYTVLFFSFLFVIFFQVEQALAAPCMTPEIRAVKIKICNSKGLFLQELTCSCEGATKDDSTPNYGKDGNRETSPTVTKGPLSKPPAATKTPVKVKKDDKKNTSQTTERSCACKQAKYVFGSGQLESICFLGTSGQLSYFPLPSVESPCPNEAEIDARCKQNGENYSLNKDKTCMCGGDTFKHFQIVERKCVRISEAAEKKCTGEGEIEDKDGKCACDESKGYANNASENANISCEKVADSKSNETPSCLKAFEAKAAECKNDGIKAAKTCNKDSKDSNEQWGAAQSVIGSMSQVMQMHGQQQGSAETCFQAGALATTTYGAMDLLKTTCDKEIGECHSICEQATTAYEAVTEGKCESEILRQPQSQQESYKKALLGKAKKIHDELENGLEACESDAKTNQARIIDMMNGMNKSAQQAAKCQCQLTAGQTNCDQVLGPADCKLLPTDPRCPQAVTVKCAGLDYNTKECVCLRDPKAINCIGASGSAPSTVAGFNPIGTGGVNLKPTGGGSGGIGDLGYDAAGNPISSDKTSGGVNSPFGTANSGGGSGGGAASGGDSDQSGQEGATSEPEGKTGIGGMFNNLKTQLSGLFGGGSNKKGTSADGKKFKDGKNAGSVVDPNKWRPVGLRGIAGGSGIGSKNSDIFKMVNNQYNNQYHTLMTLPEEKPK